MEDCEKDPVCKATYADYLANPDAPPPTSSEGSTTNPTSSNSAGTPTSSAGKLVIGGNSSASQTGTSSANGSTVTSSASTSNPGESGCAPDKSSITQGESTTWTFTPVPADMAYLNAEYTWTFGTDTDAGVGKMTSKAVTYMTTGPQTASVVVKNGLSEEKYDCSPVQVNSPDKPKCTCTGAGGDVSDPAKAPITWTADCGTASNLTYVWDGTPGEASTYTVTPTAADVGTKKSVTLSLKAIDGSEFSGYTCDEVKVTDGPEYELTFVDTEVTPGDITVPSDGCISVSGTWSQGHNPPLKMLCDLVDAEATCSMTLKYGTASETTTGSYSISNLTIELKSSLTQGEFASDGTVCVSFTGGSAAKCKLGMY